MNPDCSSAGEHPAWDREVAGSIPVSQTTELWNRVIREHKWLTDRRLDLYWCICGKKFRTPVIHDDELVVEWMTHCFQVWTTLLMKSIADFLANQVVKTLSEFLESDEKEKSEEYLLCTDGMHTFKRVDAGERCVCGQCRLTLVREEMNPARSVLEVQFRPCIWDSEGRCNIHPECWTKEYRG
jgi:hypothetical protein